MIDYWLMIHASRRMTTLILCLARVDTMPKDGRYHGIEIPLWEALEEIASGVFENARLNDEYAGDGCLYDVHDDWLLITDCWLLIIHSANNKLVFN